MDCSPPGSAVHGISQARQLKEIAISFSRASFQLRDRSHISCIGRWILYHWATWWCCSVTELCMTLCNPMDWSTLGLPVSHYLLEFAQVHVHCIGDAIQPSHPATLFFCCPQSFPASGSFPVSWLFASSGQSTGGSASAPVLPMYIHGWFPLGLTGLISSLSKGLKSLCSWLYSLLLDHNTIILPLIYSSCF